MATGAEPARATGWGLFAEWHALIEHGDPRFSFLATVTEVDEPLARLEGSIRVSMWNMQRHHSIYTMRDAAEADANMRRRGVEVRFILPRRVAERRSPLVSSQEPDTRLAPVAHPMMIQDGRLVLLGDSTGETVWTSTDAGVVDSAVGLYEWLWQQAEPAVPDGEQPPFTPRMVQIAFRLIDGATDREIARSLGVSERTVSADIRELSRRLGARSRAEAIARVAGLGG